MFDQIDAEKLISAWTDVKQKAYTDYNMRIDLNKYPISNKNEDIFDFFTYFKLIPTARASFDSAVKHFMVYSEVRIFWFVSQVWIELILNRFFSGSK